MGALVTNNLETAGLHMGLDVPQGPQPSTAEVVRIRTVRVQPGTQTLSVPSEKFVGDHLQRRLEGHEVSASRIVQKCPHAPASLRGHQRKPLKVEPSALKLTDLRPSPETGVIRFMDYEWVEVVELDVAAPQWNPAWKDHHPLPLLRRLPQLVGRRLELLSAFVRS